MTRRRDDVLVALEEADGFASAQQIYARLRARGERIGLATVYRQLQALADAGQVDLLRADDGEQVYRRCTTDRHHHHLVCRSCGRTVEVEGRPVERWAAQVAGEHGYVDVGHTVEIFGRCPGCAGAAGPAG